MTTATALKIAQIEVDRLNGRLATVFNKLSDKKIVKAALSGHPTLDLSYINFLEHIAQAFTMGGYEAFTLPNKEMIERLESINHFTERCNALGVDLDLSKIDHSDIKFSISLRNADQLKL